MRIHLISDLHLDHATLSADLPLPPCDVRVVAGDLCEYHHRSEFAVPVLRHLATGGVPVVMILGNHDHYSLHHEHPITTYHERIAGWRATCQQAGVQLLECEHLDVGGYRLLGCTWWSAVDWLEPGSHRGRRRYPSDAAYVQHATELSISDFRLITDWDLAAHLRSHAQATQWLTRELSEATDPARQRIVITHFLPHRATIHPVFRGSMINAYFTNHAPELVRQAAVWLFGHTHVYTDVVAEGVRLVANPRGYPKETSGFIPDLVITV